MTAFDIHYQFAQLFQNEPIRPYAYALSKAMQEGHICLPLQDVSDYLTDSPYAEVSLERNWSEMQAYLSEDVASHSPLLISGEALYFNRYYRYETRCINALADRIAYEANLQSDRCLELSKMQAQLLQWFAAENTSSEPSINTVNWQLMACLQSYINQFSIISGGPGTGKTTTISKLIALLSAQSSELRIAIAAPTGKAAMRMKASLESAAQQFDASVQAIMHNLQPFTIHRLLQYQFNTVDFKYNKQQPLPLDVLIVDEASMIDFALMTKLLEAVPLNCRVIFLGDANQLASVEAGSLFGDLCQCIAQGTTVSQHLYDWYQTHLSKSHGALPASILPQQPHLLNGHIVQLIKSHRFKADSGIAQMAKWVIEQSQSNLEQFTQTADQQVYLESDLSEAIKAYANALSQYIEEPNTALALQKFQSIRLLAVTREGPKGLKQLNKQIEVYLAKHYGLNPQAEFYLNRPVMITKNHPELGLFNGDIGIVRPDQDGVLKIWFETSDQTVKGFMPGLFAQCETVFAMTVHKSQGSEFDFVWVVLPESGADQLMTCELLYTAITRGKQSVCIQANQAQLVSAIQRRVKRSSGIIKRLSWA